MSATKCSVRGCDRDARARGYCDTHYRRSRKGKDLIRPIGVGGIEPKDDEVFKIRVQKENGSQPVYYSDPKQAHRAAERAEEDGSLLFFGRYTLAETLDSGDS